MWSFTYKNGDRPLDGYTIERAAGRGGFGEVYYALSDSGREVALKAVQGYEQIELRGISQCMNLKSPHLVSIFDVRHNDQGKPFVIMEFVNGPSLRQLLDENPAGLGTQKSAFFLREIAKGLTFLHDCGIVHRDLKPGNIFYENGYVKIGDYGLSKCISPTHNSQQTITVGTVHYMAPEVGVGKYDRSIDIYAMGAVLYEMLTGTPPYLGATPSEILLKHLSAEPDYTNVQEPFRAVVRKAMAKKPEDRYQTVQEMVEAIFGEEHIRQSVSVFSPESLSMVAGRVAGKVAVTAGVGGSSRMSGPTAAQQADVWTKMGSWVDQVGHKVGHIGRIPPDGSVPPPLPPIVVNDPMQARHRVILVVGIAATAAILAGAFSSNQRDTGAYVFLAITTTIGMAVGSSILRKFILPAMQYEAPFLRRIAGGFVIAACVAILSLPALSASERVARTLLAICIPLFFFDLQKYLAPDRDQRVPFWQLPLLAAIVAWICSGMLEGSVHAALIISCASAAAMLLAAPWDPVLSARAAQLGIEPGTEPVLPTPPAASKPAIEQPVAGHRTVPPGVRTAWLVLLIITLPLGVGLFILGGMSRDYDECTFSICFGVASTLLAILAIVRYQTDRYYGIWNYLFRWLIMWLGATLAISPWIFAGLMPSRAVEPVAVILLSCLGISALLCGALFPGKRSSSLRAVAIPVSSGGQSFYSRTVAILLAILPLLSSICGLQRFYVGKIGTGILWLCTFGLFGIGQLVDIIMICCGSFTDAAGQPLLRWETSAQPGMSPAPVPPVVMPPQSMVTAVPSPIVEAVALPAAVAPAAVAPAAFAAPVVEVRRRSKRRRSISGGFFSVVTAVLLLGSFVTAVGLALDIPQAIVAGIPDSSLARELETQVFQYPEWPALVRKLGYAALGLLAMLSLAAMILSRRESGALHLLRGVLGIGILLLATRPLSIAWDFSTFYNNLSGLIQHQALVPAIDYALNSASPKALLGSAGLILLSLTLIAWRRPRRELEAA